MITRTLFGAGLIAALLGLAAPLAAQDRCDGDSIPCSRELRSNGQVEEALAMLLRIRESDDSTLVQGQIGLAYTDLQRWEDAHMELSSARERGGPWVEENGERIAQVLAFVAEHLTLLRFEGALEGAELVVNGRPRGTFPLPQPVGISSGAIEVLVRREGFEPFTTTLTGAVGESATVEVALREGAGAGSSEPSPTPAPPGGGGADPAPWIVVGAGALVAVAGAVLLGVGQAEVAAVNEPPGDPSWEDFEGRADTALALSNAGVVLLPVGLAVALAGVIWGALAGDGAPSTETARRATELRF